MMTTNTRPTYDVRPVRSNYGNGDKIIPNRFEILEFRDSDVYPICEMSNHGDRLNNILKRGIPLDDARKLFYQMDG